MRFPTIITLRLQVFLKIWLQIPSAWLQCSLEAPRTVRIPVHYGSVWRYILKLKFVPIFFHFPFFFTYLLSCSFVAKLVLNPTNNLPPPLSVSSMSSWTLLFVSLLASFLLVHFHKLFCVFSPYFSSGCAQPILIYVFNHAYHYLIPLTAS